MYLTQFLINLYDFRLDRKLNVFTFYDNITKILTILFVLLLIKHSKSRKHWDSFGSHCTSVRISTKITSVSSLLPVSLLRDSVPTLYSEIQGPLAWSGAAHELKPSPVRHLCLTPTPPRTPEFRSRR